MSSDMQTNRHERMNMPLIRSDIPGVEILNAVTKRDANVVANFCV